MKGKEGRKEERKKERKKEREETEKMERRKKENGSYKINMISLKYFPLS